MSTGKGISSLWKNEDWWAVWIGFAILILAVVLASLGYGVKAPKIQRWAASPLDAFYSDVTVKVKDWPKSLQSTTAISVALPGQIAERFHYSRKVRYEQGKRKVSEKIAWKSRYPMSETDRDAIRQAAASPAQNDAINQLHKNASPPGITSWR